MHVVAERPYLYNGGFCCLAHGLVKISGCLPEEKRKKGKIKTCVKKYYCVNHLAFQGFEAVSAVADTALLWPDVITSTV